MLRHVPYQLLMSEVEIITDRGWQCRWSTAGKLRIIEETLNERARISGEAGCNGVAPHLLYRWLQFLLEGGSFDEAEDERSPTTKSSDRLRSASVNSNINTAARRRARDPARSLGQFTVKKSTFLTRCPFKSDPE